MAIIPAQGGSKRIPNKNIRLFGVQPIIEAGSVVFSERAIPIVQPTNCVVDTTLIDDWNHTEWLYQAHHVLSN